MRITGGTWRGRRFKPMKSFKGRPTTDFAREGLFNLLRSRIELDGARVLDLFAGTGIVGMECASRGAASITVIEKQRNACAYIKSCFEELGYDGAKVINMNAFKFLEGVGGRYDLVFADPPYDLKNLAKIPESVNTSGVLSQDGLFILEHGDSYNFNGIPGFVEMRKYGHVHFSFFTFEL